MKSYTAEERIRIIGKALAHPLPTPHTIRFQDRYQPLPVVELSLDLLLHNPSNHRIRAQLESHPKRGEILADPAGFDGQRLIAEMLAAVEHFDELKENLDQDGQREPGLCTPDGVLINANRRKEALRQLGRRTMRVAILPVAPQSDYDDLELDLQVRKDYREPYSFTNELLIVQELLNQRNLTEAQVARRIGLCASDRPPELKAGVEAVRACTRKLHLIRRLQQLSGGRMPLCHFDADKMTIDEVDRDHQRLLKTTRDIHRAERLLLMRLVGMLVGVDYRLLREVDENFLDVHLLPLLRGKPEWRPYVELFVGASPTTPTASDELPGLDLLTPEMPAPDVFPSAGDPEAALKRIVAARPEEQIDLPGAGPLAWSQVAKHLNEAIDRAAKDARDDRKAAARAEGPFRRLDQIEHLLGIVVARSAEFTAEADFDHADYRARVRRIAALVEQMEQTLEKEDNA